MPEPTRLPHYLETSRLVLRQWTERDAAALDEAITQSLDHLLPWMPRAADEPADIADRRKMIAEWRTSWEQGGDAVIGIFRGGAIVGGTGLHRRGAEDSLEVGYWAHVDQTGNGYITEAAAALTDAAFRIGGINTVEICHDLANQPSRRIPEVLGFTFVEQSPRAAQAKAETGVECRWAVSRTDWEQRRTAQSGLR